MIVCKERGCTACGGFGWLSMECVDGMHGVTAAAAVQGIVYHKLYSQIVSPRACSCPCRVRSRRSNPAAACPHRGAAAAAAQTRLQTVVLAMA